MAVERWINYCISGSLAALGFSIVWLFATERLYEPNTAVKYFEMTLAGLLGLVGAAWAIRTWIVLYREEVPNETTKPR